MASSPLARQLNPSLVDLTEGLRVQIATLQREIDALPVALYGVNSDQGSSAQPISDTVRRRFQRIDVASLVRRFDELGEKYNSKIAQLHNKVEAERLMGHEQKMELEIRHKSEVHELQVKLDLKDLDWRGHLQTKEELHSKELEELRAQKRQLQKKCEIQGKAIEKAQGVYEKRMEEIYREINSLGDIVDESVMGSPAHNPGGGSGGTLTNTQRAIQDALTLLKHRVAYFMQDNLTSLFKGHDLLLPRLDDTDNTATGKIHLNSGSLEREWDADDGRINNHPPMIASDQLSPISRNEEHKGRFEERKGIIQSESNTERRLLQELMKVDEAVIQREPNESIDKFRMSGQPILSSKQRTRHFSDTISTSRQRAREHRAQAPDLMTRTRSSQAQQLADFLDDQLELGLGMSRAVQGAQPSSNQLDFNNNISPVSLATPNSPHQAMAGAPQRQSRAHPKVPPIAGLLQMREQEESNLRYRDIPQIQDTPQSSSTAGLNQGFLNCESESKLIESEPEQLQSAQMPQSNKASDIQTGQSGGSHLDSNMLRFIRKVQDSLQEESKGGERLNEPDLTQQLSEYLNIDLNKLSLSQRERVVYSMINPQYQEESLSNAQMEVRLEDLLKVSRSGSEFKIAISGENSGHNQGHWMPGEAALAHIESVGDAMAQKLIIQYGLESNKSKKSKGKGGGRQMEDTENSEPLNTNGEFDEEVRGIVERAGILQKLQQQAEEKEREEGETQRLFQDQQRRQLKKKFNQVHSSPPKDLRKDNMFKARRGSGAGVLDHKQEEENFLGEMQQIAKEFDQHPSQFEDQFGRNNVKSSEARRKKKSPFPRHQLSPLDFAVIAQRSVEGKEAPFQEEEDSLMQEISHLEQLGNQVRQTRAQMHEPSGFEPLFSRGHYERDTLGSLEDQKRRAGQSRENTVAMRENALLDLKLSLERNNGRRGMGPRSPDLKRDTDIEIPISQIEDISPHSIDRKQKKSRRVDKSPQNLSGGKGGGANIVRSQESSKSGQLSQKAREAQRRYLTPDLDNQGRQQVPFKGKAGKALQKNILALNRRVPKKNKQIEMVGGGVAGLKTSSMDASEQPEGGQEHTSHHSSFNSEASRFLKRREAQSPILTGPVPIGSRQDSKIWGGSAQSSIGYPPTNSLLDVNKSVDSALMRANFQAQLEQGGVSVKSSQRKGAVGPQMTSPKIQDRSKAKSQIRSAMGYYENHNFGGASFQQALGVHKQQGGHYPTKTPLRASVTPQNMVAYSVTPPGMRATPGLKSSTVMSQYKQNQNSASSQQKANSFIQEDQRASYTSQADSQDLQSPGKIDSRPSIRVKKRTQDGASRFKPNQADKSRDLGLPGVHGPQPPSRSFDQAQPESNKKRPGLMLKNFVRGPPKFQGKGPGALKRPSSAKVTEPPQLNKQSRPSAPIPGERRQGLQEQKAQPSPFHHVSPNIKYQKPPGSSQGIGSPQQPQTDSKRPLLRGGLKFQSYGQVVTKNRISSANAGNRPVQKIPVNAISFISAQNKQANNSSMLSEQPHNLSMQEQPYKGGRPRAFERNQFKMAKPGRLVSGAAALLEGLHKQQPK